MRKSDDLTGRKFGRLTVLERDCLRPKGKPHWVCKCDCGQYTVTSSSNLKEGHTRSCGCLHIEHTKRIRPKSPGRRTHGMTNTKLYNVWVNMIERCTTKSSTVYSFYGGRGISVCEEWRRFEPFYEWAVANGYREDLTIDRIDVNGNYEPSNCRWATKKEQANNRRSSRIATYNGETHTVAEWSDITGIKQGTLHYRLSKGWSVDRALTEKIHR